MDFLKIGLIFVGGYVIGRMSAAGETPEQAIKGGIGDIEALVGRFNSNGQLPASNIQQSGNNWPTTIEGKILA